MTEIDIKPDTAPTLEQKKNETFDEERALAVAKRILEEHLDAFLELAK